MSCLAISSGCKSVNFKNASTKLTGSLGCGGAPEGKVFKTTKPK